MNDPVRKHPFRNPNIPPFSQDHLNSQPTSCLTKTHNLGPERIRVHELSHGAHCQGALSDPPGQAWFPCLAFISVTSPTYRALVHLPRTFLIVPPTRAPRAAGSKRASVSCGRALTPRRSDPEHTQTMCGWTPPPARLSPAGT